MRSDVLEKLNGKAVLFTATAASRPGNFGSYRQTVREITQIEFVTSPVRARLLETARFVSNPPIPKF